MKKVRSETLGNHKDEGEGGNSRPVKAELWAALRTSLEEALIVGGDFRAMKMGRYRVRLRGWAYEFVGS